MIGLNLELREYPVDNNYLVSPSGVVISKGRYITFSDGRVIYKQEKELTPQICKSGYYRLRLAINGTKKSVRIHRVVAETYIPNPENLPQVNHKDGNKLNNCVSNLEWCDNSHNQKHAVSLGFRRHGSGTRATAFKSGVDVYKGDVYITTLFGNKQMKEFGLDPRLISACLHGKRNSHGGYTFKRQNEENKHEN